MVSLSSLLPKENYSAWVRSSADMVQIHQNRKKAVSINILPVQSNSEMKNNIAETILY